MLQHNYLTAAKKYSYSSSYVVACALATVLIDNLVNNIAPVAVLFYVTIIAVVYFHCINFGKMTAIYLAFLRQHRKEFLLINLLIAAIWMCTYFGNYYSSATIFNYLFFISLGIVSRFKTIDLMKNNSLRIVLCLVLIAAPFLLYPAQMYGALLAVAGGTLVLFYNMTTYNLATKTNITASQTLAIRFWGLLTILLMLSANKLNMDALNLNIVTKIIILAFLSFILQIWLSQKGLFAIGVKLHGVILSLTPLATLILQGLLLHQWYWHLLSLTIISPFILNDSLWDGIKRYFMIKQIEKIKD